MGIDVKLNLLLLSTKWFRPAFSRWEIVGSNPTKASIWSHGVMVITLAFEARDLSSILGGSLVLDMT